MLAWNRPHGFGLSILRKMRDKAVLPEYDLRRDQDYPAGPSLPVWVPDEGGMKWLMS